MKKQNSGFFTKPSGKAKPAVATKIKPHGKSTKMDADHDRDFMTDRDKDGDGKRRK